MTDNSPVCKSCGVPFEDHPGIQAICKNAKEIVDRISELSAKITPDYPGLNELNSWAKLWAIEQSFDGLSMALEDWQQFGSHLAEKLGMSVDEITATWEEIITKGTNDH